MGLAACSDEIKPGDASTGSGGPGGDTSTSASGPGTGETGGDATGSTGTGVPTSGGETGESSGSGESGGDVPNGACPTDQFPAERRIVFDSGSSSISTDTVWTKDNLYIVVAELEVGAVLTIEAGTTVCFGNEFGSRGSLTVALSPSAGIRVEGTEAEHVTFTAIDPDEGWDGVIVYDAASVVEFAYTDFLYGSQLELDPGYFSYGMLRIRGAEDSMNPPARLHHVTFAAAKRGGALWLEGPAGLTADSVVRVEGFDLATDELGEVDSAVLVSLRAASTLAPGMISIAPEVPEPFRGVELLSKVSLYADVTLPALDLPYLVRRALFVSGPSGLPSRTLTIAAGAELRLGSAATIQVGTESLVDGDLIVDGSAEEPVRFVYYPFPDAFLDRWGGLYFIRYDAAVSRVSHAVLENAGGSSLAEVEDACGDASTGAIILTSLSIGGDYPGIAIDHTTIDRSMTNGIVAECGFGCIDPATDYLDPALGNVFLDVAGAPQILATCP